WQGTCSLSPVFVFSIVTASIWPSPWISRTSQGVMMRTRPSPSSARASLTEDSSARKLSRRGTRAIGCCAVSCRPSVQSSAASPHRGAVRQALLGAELDQLRAENLRVAGNVVDVLLGVDGRDLAAELLEALDDPHGGVAVAGVVRGREARGARPEDGDVDDAVSAHAKPRFVRARTAGSNWMRSVSTASNASPLRGRLSRGAAGAPPGLG